MIEDLSKKKLDEVFAEPLEPSLLYEEDDQDYDTTGSHIHHHNHDDAS